MKVSAPILAAALVAVTFARGDEGPAKTVVLDPQIPAVVAYFEKHGIKLVPGERGWWRVAEPKAEGYDVVVHIRSFVDDATEKEMKEILEMINLAYLLNVPAHVAMSHPSLQIKDPKVKAPKPKEVPVVEKMERLFKEYKPAPKAPGK